MRTYIDDLRYDVGRSYWYIWTQKPYDLLGIQAYPGSDAEQGFFALENWVIGADFGGCATEDSGAVVCDFSGRHLVGRRLGGERGRALHGPRGRQADLRPAGELPGGRGRAPRSP